MGGDGGPRQWARADGGAVVVQAGGDATVHLGARPRVRPVAVPVAAERFTGRQRVVDGLLRHLAPDADHNGVAAVTGMGGVGKTSLAVQVAREGLARGLFPGGVLFENLHGYSTVESVPPGAAAGRLLRALGVPPGEVPPDDERVTAWRSAIARERQPVLVVLDNAGSAGQVAPLLAEPPHRTLITSRTVLSALAARAFPLDVFEPDESVRFLDTALRTARPDDGRVTGAHPDAVELAGYCGHLPLALKVVVALLRDDPGTTVADLAEVLRDERTRLAELGYPDEDGEHRPLAVRAAFELSYRELTDAQARAFRLLTAVPGPSASTEAVTAALDLPDRRSRRLVTDLARLHLLDRLPGDRWRMHDLVRLYAEERAAADTGADRPAAARDRVHAHYAARATAANRWSGRRSLVTDEEERRHREAVAWWDGEAPAVVAAVVAAHRDGRHDVVLRLAEALSGHLENRHRLDDAVLVGRTALDSARHLDVTAVRRASSLLGNAYRLAHRYRDAIPLLEEACRLSEEDTEEAGAHLHNLGLAHFRNGDFAEAERCHARDYRICRRQGRVVGVIGAMTARADALRMLDRVAEAVHLLNGSIVLSIAVGSRRDEALARVNLAVTCLDNLPGTRAGFVIWQLCRALRIACEDGDVRGRASVLRNLAAAYRLRDQCHRDAAWHWRRRAAELYRELGDPGLAAAIEDQEWVDPPHPAEDCVHERGDREVAHRVREWLEDLPHAVLRGDHGRLDEAAFAGESLVWLGSTRTDRAREINPRGLLLGLEDPRAETMTSPLADTTWEAVAAVVGRVEADPVAAVERVAPLLVDDLTAAAHRPIPAGELGRAVDAVADVWSAAEPHLSRLAEFTVEALLPARAAVVNHLVVLGRAREAVAHGESTLSDALRLLGPAHHVTATARANLGGALLAVGRTDRATELFVANTDHPTGDDRARLAARRNVAVAHYASGRAPVASKLLRDALRDEARLLGPDDPDSVGTRYWLARCLADTGRVAEAVEHLERARDHPGTTPALSRELRQVRLLLIALYRRSGRARDALLETWA
ncbi:tetratricopeptide repeat protein [Actinosynnema sp. NPDC053489]|uniref:tetratricopeptide repeat protein n=1 Tax=Actinosynnema sp. NPDC053489 TaxID=3363916 RepID=UPI0037CC07C7